MKMSQDINANDRVYVCCYKGTTMREHKSEQRDTFIKGTIGAAKISL